VSCGKVQAIAVGAECESARVSAPAASVVPLQIAAPTRQSMPYGLLNRRVGVGRNERITLGLLSRGSRWSRDRSMRQLTP